MLRQIGTLIASGAVIAAIFAAFSPAGQWVSEASSNGGIVLVAPPPKCDYWFSPLPDITAYELARIQIGMNNPTLNPNKDEVAALSRHFTGVSCK